MIMEAPFPLRPIEEGMKGKVAIVTGATMGIGKAIAQAFCWAGMKVVAAGRSTDKGQALAAECNEKYAGECTFMTCDVNREADLAALVDLAVTTYGKLDVLVNCAGYFPKQKPIDDVPVQDFLDILQTNLVAYYALARLALPYLRSSKGNIINIGSVVGTTGDEGAITYCATKGGIESMTRTMAVDEARNGVRVNEVKPGHICTEMFELTTSRQPDPDAFVAYSDTLQWMGRGGAAQEVATGVLFLASEWASFITGVSLFITGGYEFGEGPKRPIFDWPQMEKK